MYIRTYENLPKRALPNLLAKLVATSNYQFHKTYKNR